MLGEPLEPVVPLLSGEDLPGDVGALGLVVPVLPADWPGGGLCPFVVVTEVEAPPVVVPAGALEGCDGVEPPPPVVEPLVSVFPAVVVKPPADDVGALDKVEIAPLELPVEPLPVEEGSLTGDVAPDGCVEDDFPAEVESFGLVLPLLPGADVV